MTTHTTTTYETNGHRMQVERDQTGRLRVIDMPRPSDWHAHVRQGALMHSVAGAIMCWVKYLLVMPNTGPIRTLKEVHRYYDELVAIRDHLGHPVEFVMTLYFTDLLTPDVVDQLTRLPFRCEVKYYPPTKGATTGSGYGIPWQQGTQTLQAMTSSGVPLLGHFESTHDQHGRELPHTEREGYFMDYEFPRLRDTFPDLRICIEHASTEKAVRCVQADGSGNTICSVTPHHLLFTMEELLEKSWKNHGRCMPYLKDEADRAALTAFTFSGDPRVAAGGDTAPHPARTKEGVFETAACGCWLPHEASLYTLAAERARALDERFIQFMCLNGALWRGLPAPATHERLRIVATDSPNDIPAPVQIVDGSDVVIPLGWTTEADRLKIGLAMLEDMHC